MAKIGKEERGNNGKFSMKVPMKTFLSDCVSVVSSLCPYFE